MKVKIAHLGIYNKQEKILPSSGSAEEALSSLYTIWLLLHIPAIKSMAKGSLQNETSPPSARVAVMRSSQNKTSLKNS